MMDDRTDSGPDWSAEATARYRYIFQRANDAIFVIDAERDRILDVNEQACRMLSYSREELLALPVSATHPDDIGRMRQFVTSIVEHGAGWTDDLTCVTKFGERVPAEISASVFGTPGRTVLLGLVRPRIDDQFRKLFEWLFESSPNAAVVTDERGRMALVNPQLEAVFGYSRGELLGRPVEMLIPERFHDVHAAHREGFNRQPRMRPMGLGLELFGRRKDGSEFPVDIELSPVTGTGLVLSVVRDVSEQKREHTRLRQQAAELQQIVEQNHRLFQSSPDATLVADASGQISMVNPQLERLFGYSRAEMLGETIEMLVPERLRDAHVAHREDFHRHPRMRPMGAGLELHGRRKDGTGFPIDIQLSPVAGTGLALAVVRDVSELKGKSERLEQRAAGLQELLEQRSAQLRRTEERQDVLLEVNNAIVGSLDRESLFEAIARALRNVIRFDRASIALADMSRGVSTLRLLMGQAVEGLSVGAEISHGKDSLMKRVLEERRPLVVRDFRLEPDVEPQNVMVEFVVRQGFRSGIVAPLLSQHGAIGTINLGSLTPGQYSDDDADFLTQVGSQLAFAIENTLAYEEIARLKASLEQENIYLQEEIKTEHPYEEIVGHSVALRKIAQAVETVAATDATVLITGETGTGKELIARAVHNRSPRRTKTMVKLNCAALPSGLVESELFGHEKGAFTGAVARKIGRFEVAHGSTIFLDEVGDLPMDLQAKLLRVLQEGEFERVGSTHTIKVNTRVIAATNQDLDKAMRDGRFRPDLYYRLSVFPITLSPLRDRSEDIPPLVRHLVMKCCTKLAKRIETIPSAAMEALRAYSWPGNVRELENVIERAVILSRGPQLDLREWTPPAREAARETGLLTLEDVERRHIQNVLESTGWVVSGEKGAAKLLGLKPTTLEARMKKLGITRTV